MTRDESQFGPDVDSFRPDRHVEAEGKLKSDEGFFNFGTGEEEDFT